MNRTNQPASSASWMEALGRLVGLSLSVVYVVFVLWWIVSDRIGEASIPALQFMRGFMIILGGPIAFFFINSIAKFQLKVGGAVLTFAGGYGVSFAAVLLITNFGNPEPIARSIQTVIVIDHNGILAERVKCVKHEPWGAVQEAIIDTPHGPQKALICRFDPQVSTVTVWLTIDNKDFGEDQIVWLIKRDVPLGTMRSLYEVQTDRPGGPD